MIWTVKDIIQETDHPYLNFFTFVFAVQGEDGQEKEYRYFVASRNDKEHLRIKTQDYHRPDGVVMALYRKRDGHIDMLMTKQFRPALGRHLISFPAGLLEKDDDVISAAKREAQEEGGVIIDHVELLAPSSPTSSGLSDEMVSVVLGEIVDYADRHLEAFEDIATEYVDLADVPALLSDEKKTVPLNVRLVLLYLRERFGY